MHYHFYQQPQRAGSTGSINPPNGLSFSCFSHPIYPAPLPKLIQYRPPASLCKSFDIASKAPDLPNTHVVLPDHQCFTPVKLTLPSPCRTDTSSHLLPMPKPTPASLSGPTQVWPCDEADGLPQAPLALLPPGSEQLLTFDSSYMLPCTLHCPYDFLLISTASLLNAKTTSSAILYLPRYLERWKLTATFLLFLIALNCAGVWTVWVDPSCSGTAERKSQ